MGDALAKMGAMSSIVHEEARPSRLTPEPKKKPAARKQAAPKPAVKKVPTSKAPPAPPSPVIVIGTRSNFRGRVASRKLVM
jgi:hypothetical protein